MNHKVLQPILFLYVKLVQKVFASLEIKKMCKESSKFKIKSLVLGIKLVLMKKNMSKGIIDKRSKISLQEYLKMMMVKAKVKHFYSNLRYHIQSLVSQF